MGPTQPFEIQVYKTAAGRIPFHDWLNGIGDVSTIRRIRARIVRVGEGDLGDHRHVGAGIWEMRLQFGPGYRVYFAFEQRRLILLLAGGHKGTQSRDIARAKDYYDDYRQSQSAVRELV